MYFAVKSIGMSTRAGRKPQTLLDAARHNLREIQAERGADGHIDPKRIDQNKVMRGPSTAAEVVMLAQKWCASAGVEPTKLRKDYCQAIELVFSLPVDAATNSDAYFEVCLQWAEGAYDLPILLATAHHDEGAKHLHVLLLPLQNEAYVGSAPVAIPTTKVRRESFFQKVAGPHGFKRSNAKLQGVVKTWGVRAVLDRIEAEGIQACAEALWPTIRAAIERDPTPAMLALKIDINSIRPDHAKKEAACSAKAIGFESPETSPIGFRSISALDQNLSCVGLPKEVCERSPLSAARRHTSQFKQGSTVLRARPAASPSGTLPPEEDADGIVRERDGFCQTPDAWLD